LERAALAPQFADRGVREPQQVTLTVLCVVREAARQSLAQLIPIGMSELRIASDELPRSVEREADQIGGLVIQGSVIEGSVVDQHGTHSCVTPIELFTELAAESSVACGASQQYDAPQRAETNVSKIILYCFNSDRQSRLDRGGAAVE
jgi:hypothetical protein